MNKQMIGTGHWFRLSKTGHSFVVDMLGTEIVSGKIPVGSLMPGDAKLIERFRVSRTVLRESMKTLGAKGLIVARARIGTRVNDRNTWNMFDREVLRWHVAGALNSDFITQVCDIRLAVEPMAAALAADHASEDDIAILLEFTNIMSSQNLTIETFVRTILDFHLRLLEASQNPFMRGLGNVVEASLVPLFRTGSHLPDLTVSAVLTQSCRQVAEAVRDRSREKARRAMIAHIEMCKSHYQEGLSIKHH